MIITMLANFHVCFRCMIFSLSGPCVIIFALFYCLLDMRSGECNGETIRNMFGCVCYFVTLLLLFLCCFLCVILHTMSSGKSMQLLCIFLFGMVCLSDISMMFVKIPLAVCMLLGMVV